ncbi:MAG: nuclear transport factor 2 family protein [Pseudomonadota bacterium]
MQRRLLAFVLTALTLTAAASDEDTQRLEDLLDTFLAGASVGDVAVHERFWADDLVYTSSNGTRTDKAGIVAGMRAAEDSREAPPSVVYSAENVDIRLYGDMAVVAFRLVGTAQDGERSRSEYFNTGTFQKRDGEWRAVAWQATIIPDLP